MITPQTSQPSTTVPSLRTGAEYLRSLNDGRQVFVDGERVVDVTKHPAFREAARSVARLYDIAAAPEMRDRMTFSSPKTGGPVLRAFKFRETMRIYARGGYSLRHGRKQPSA
jgi:4-hydroxyphenylacetate 3-monooxygenase